jgi:phosphoenolpyruvate carboxykinase (GTP)
MAMKPFTGYNYGDYFGHWLNVGAKLKNPPRIFHVNWFRQASNGDFLWPGFGDNLRVLEWILDRCAKRVGATDTAIGWLPKPSDLNLSGLQIAPEVMQELTTVHVDAWRREAADFRSYLLEYGSHMPPEMLDELAGVEQRLGA